MVDATNDFHFHGRGDTRELEPLKDTIRPWGGTFGPWKRRRNEKPIPDDDKKPPEHPANYSATQDLADAVNTAIALGKPLLVTGNPGTGKSQLAERIAWELNLGPVLRFEAQSLSEANDLFYRFDLVGYLSAVELYKSGFGGANPSPKQFLKLGPLGEAIVRSDPEKHAELFEAAFGPSEERRARPSVVLIDEIDKASRDFPNDLLNGIERREFAVREMKLDSIIHNPSYPAIVLITSNSERDLPAPFLRRCTFFHIGDPTKETLRDILIRKFFPWTNGSGGKRREELPPFYAQLLDRFWLYRESNPQSLQYTPGTSELIDWTQALIKANAEPAASFSAQLAKVKQTASSVAKHREDLKALMEFIKTEAPRTA
jgi:MoxR-like ATPase